MTVNGRVFVLTFAILALELALIRWTAGQVRIFAYFGNLVLIVVFLGLGIGTALGRHGHSRLDRAFPSLALLAAALAFAPSLGITQMQFPDPSVALWGGNKVVYSFVEVCRNTAIFVALPGLIALSFAFIGTELGGLFSRAGRRGIDAYAADLAGSLAGTLCFAAATVLEASPPVWLALGLLPLLALRPRWLNGLLAASIVALGYVSIEGAFFSPYNRIDVSFDDSGFGINVDVNRDFHQVIWNFSEQNLRASREFRAIEAIYDLPFRISDHRASAVIVGAGTGNDAQAAVRNGYRHVVAVDIDPVILAIGAELHPDHPYSAGGVETVVDDARAFFKAYDGPKFDAVVYGLLDSHAMASAMSSIRLDNFVYTVEGIRDAWRQVSDDGHLTIGFSVISGMWLAERLYRLVYAATGIEPLAFYHNVHFGTTFIVSRNPAVMDHARVAGLVSGNPVQWLKFEPALAAMRVPSDDWPYLYVRPGVFPWIYVLVVALVLAAAGVSVPLAYGRGVMRTDFDPPMFLIGAAFLLLETRGITALSLLYGSTWIVNVVVFAGILTMALVATLMVRRYPVANPAPWFAALIVATVALWQFDLSVLNGLPLGWRGIAGGLVHALPVLFAGILFPLLLSRSPNPAAALASNLLGAVCGGCLEYASMLIGLKALVGIAAAFYAAAFLSFRISARKARVGA